MSNLSKVGLVVLDRIGNLDIKLIRPSSFRLRPLDTKTVRDLMSSIKSKGMLQPIMVRPAGKSYEVVFGLHRLEACRRLGLRKIPAIIRRFTQDESILAQIVENLQRNIFIDPIQEAEGYQSLIKKGWTITEIAYSIGKSDNYVSDRLKILKKLNPIIAKKIKPPGKGPITISHAEQLASIADASDQLRMAKLISKKGLSVRELERLMRSRAASDKCLCVSCRFFPCKVYEAFIKTKVTEIETSKIRR